MVMDYLGRFDVSGEVFPGIDSVDNQAACCELPVGLGQQINTIDNKVELGNDQFSLKVVCQIADIVVRKGRLTAALSMPDDALAHPFIQFLFDGLSSKKLRIPHDVL